MRLLVASLAASAEFALSAVASSPALGTSDWTNTAWADECVISNGYTYAHVYGATSGIAGSADYGMRERRQGPRGAVPVCLTAGLETPRNVSARSARNGAACGVRTIVAQENLAFSAVESTLP